MLTQLKLRDFRCFAGFELDFDSPTTVIAGPNAQGKTSLLEACCVLLRLQSPRTASLAHAIRHGQRGFVLDGFFGPSHLQFYYGQQRRKLALDSVEQKNASDYLRLAQVVWFGSDDVQLVRGPAELRRRFLDFALLQFEPTCRHWLRKFDRALRARNQLLKQPRPDWRAINAFDGPLAEAGEQIACARNRLVESLRPHAAAALHAISRQTESLELQRRPGFHGPLAEALAAARRDDTRLRQTTVGPQRDDLALTLNAHNANTASEGQQRTIALALKLGLARLLEQHAGAPPVLLIDDIFGELDPDRRNALLQKLPAGSQRIITTTHIGWMQPAPALRVLLLEQGKLRPAPQP